MRSWDEISEIGRDFMPSRLLLSAVELDIFTKISFETLSAQEIAAKMQADARATEILLDALVAQGILEKRDGRYANTEVTARYLDTASPNYQGGMLRHAANLWNSWSELTQVVRSGKPAERPRTPESGRDFILAMHHGGWEIAQLLARTLDLSWAKRMLDMGGGPGSFSIAFCEQNPELRATILDLPYALEVAREVVAEHGLSDRIELMAGDFLTDPVPKGYDFVLLSSIVHSYGDEDNRRIVRAAAEALEPSGRLAIREFVLEPDRTQPPGAAMFAINMLVNTAEGRSYMADEITGWMSEAGLDSFERIDLPGPSAVLLGTKAHH